MSKQIKSEQVSTPTKQQVKDYIEAKKKFAKLKADIRAAIKQLSKDIKDNKKSGKKAIKAKLKEDKQALKREFLRSIDGEYESLVELHEDLEQVRLAEIQRCFVHHEPCDGCVGRTRGCITSCYNHRKQRNPQVWDWIDLLHYYDFPDHAPPGCSSRWEKVDEPRFDIFDGVLKLDVDDYMARRSANPDAFLVEDSE